MVQKNLVTAFKLLRSPIECTHVGRSNAPSIIHLPFTWGKQKRKWLFLDKNAAIILQKSFNNAAAILFGRFFVWTITPGRGARVSVWDKGGKQYSWYTNNTHFFGMLKKEFSTKKMHQQIGEYHNLTMENRKQKEHIWVLEIGREFLGFAGSSKDIVVPKTINTFRGSQKKWTEVFLGFTVKLWNGREKIQ